METMQLYSKAVEKERNEGGGGGTGIDPLPGAKLSFTLGRFPREK